MKPTTFALGCGIGLSILAASLNPSVATAQDQAASVPASAGTLISLANDDTWQRYTNPTDELGKVDKYVPAKLIINQVFTAPAVGKNDKHPVYFISGRTFDTNEPGEVYLMHFSAIHNEPHLEVTVLLNGQELKRFGFADLPLNVKVADATKAGDKVTVAVRSTGDKRVSNTIGFALMRFKDGAQPGPAIATVRPPIGEAWPKMTYDGNIHPGYKARHESQQAQLLKLRPRVIFAGDSITDGYDKAGKEAWARLERFHPYNIGISGEWTQNLRWRVENSVIDQVKPELMVVMIGTNNNPYTEDEVVEGVKGVIDAIRAKSPTTRILLHGILPRSATYEPGYRFDRINDRLARFADGKTVFYMDLSEHFITPDKKVNKELIPDLLHPGAKGYEVWTDAILGKLDELLPIAMP